MNEAPPGGSHSRLHAAIFGHFTPSRRIFRLFTPSRRNFRQMMSMVITTILETYRIIRATMDLLY